MTDTTFTSRLLGSAWPGHFNRPIAEAMYENIKKVGLPQWSEDDQTLAKALQKELKEPVRGLPTQGCRNCVRRASRLRGATARTVPAVGPTGGGSDDIGDISWNVPTVTLRYPVEHSRRPGTQLGQRDRHGHADRAQGRDRRREGAGHDDARYPAAPGAGREMPGTTSTTCRPRT